MVSFWRSSGDAGSGATELARSGCSPCAALTYQPPQRSAKAVRWSVMMAPARGDAVRVREHGSDKDTGHAQRGGALMAVQTNFAALQAGFSRFIRGEGVK